MPRAARLGAQHVERLRGAGGLANLHVVLSGELQKKFDTRTVMFRALAFKSMRKQQYEPGGKIPFIFTGTDELIDDDLRAVDEIPELRFPQNEDLRIVAAET